VRNKIQLVRLEIVIVVVVVVASPRMVGIYLLYPPAVAANRRSCVASNNEVQVTADYTRGRSSSIQAKLQRLGHNIFLLGRLAVNEVNA
jgi:hypothetical protein